MESDNAKFSFAAWTSASCIGRWSWRRNAGATMVHLQRLYQRQEILEYGWILFFQHQYDCNHWGYREISLVTVRGGEAAVQWFDCHVMYLRKVDSKCWLTRCDPKVFTGEALIAWSLCDVITSRVVTLICAFTEIAELPLNANSYPNVDQDIIEKAIKGK